MDISEATLIEKAKREHKQTTEAAQRALQVAVQTAEIARDTVAELHRQGQQLDIASNCVYQVQDEVKEASSIVRFMRRFCCLAVATSCCSGCACVDSNVQRDATRARRVQQSRQLQHDAACTAALEHAVKQGQVNKLISKVQDRHDLSGEEQGRRELFGDQMTIPAQRVSTSAERRIGNGLPVEEQEELRTETQAQETCLDDIETAVDSLSIMSKAMQEELAEQLPKIESLHDRMTMAHDSLRTVARDAAHVTGRRPAEG